MKDDIKLMIDNMEWHEERNCKVENVGGMKFGKQQNPEGKLKIPDVTHHNYHSSNIESRTRTVAEIE